MSGKKSDLYRADRETGMTYKEIAEKHGVSFQMVCQACAKYNPKSFRYITEHACIFPNLRNWMNKNKVSPRELLRRMGMEPNHGNASRLQTHLTGRSELRKRTIDMLIEITGMPYEELFALNGKKGK